MTVTLYDRAATAHKQRSETAEALESCCRKEQTLSKKTGKTCEAGQSRKSFNKYAYQMHKKVPRVWASYNEKTVIILVAVIGFAFTASASDMSCVKMFHDGYGNVSLTNSCTRSVEVSVSWTDAGGRAQFRNVTVPAWDEKVQQGSGHASVAIGQNVTNVRMGEPRRVISRR